MRCDSISSSVEAYRDFYQVAIGMNHVAPEILMEAARSEAIHLLDFESSYGPAEERSIWDED
jgi:hypothetical protein